MGNLFKIFSHIAEELNVFNQELNGLYDAEYNERPHFMTNECQERYNIRDHTNKWKEMEELNMNCFYKYFLLNIRYEHEDVKAILDQFKRYDIIYNKFKKNRYSLKKLKEKKPDQNYEENERALIETKNLLDIICKIILINQTPKLWNQKIKNYNQSIEKYIQSITENPL